MTSKTCPCGQTFTPTHHRQKYCPACREARYNAAHPLKVCRKCGQATRTLMRHSSWCQSCRQAKQRADIEASRQSERAARQARHHTQGTDIDADTASWVALLEALAVAFGVLPASALSAPVDDVDPEQVDAPDQDEIDATFRDLLGGMEL